MRSLSKKITGVLLSLAMIFTLMPAVSGPVYAADIVVLPSRSACLDPWAGPRLSGTE